MRFFLLNTGFTLTFLIHWSTLRVSLANPPGVEVQSPVLAKLQTPTTMCLLTLQLVNKYLDIWLKLSCSFHWGWREVLLNPHHSGQSGRSGCKDENWKKWKKNVLDCIKHCTSWSSCRMSGIECWIWWGPWHALVVSLKFHQSPSFPNQPLLLLFPHRFLQTRPAKASR